MIASVCRWVTLRPGAGDFGLIFSRGDGGMEERGGHTANRCELHKHVRVCVCKDKISQAPPGPRANTRPRLSRAG